MCSSSALNVESATPRRSAASTTAAQCAALFMWPMTSRSQARIDQVICEASAPGSVGRIRRADTRRPAAARPQTSWNSSGRRRGAAVRQSMWTQVLAASTAPPPSPAMRVRLSAQRPPKPLHQVASSSISWKRGAVVTSIKVRRTTQAMGSGNCASAESSRATSCRYRASASSRARPRGETSPRRTRRAAASTRPDAGGDGNVVAPISVTGGTIRSSTAGTVMSGCVPRPSSVV